MAASVKLTPWEQLSDEEQTRLRVDYGHHLDNEPPTCSLETKIERFRRWLLTHGIQYREPQAETQGE